MPCSSAENQLLGPTCHHKEALFFPTKLPVSDFQRYSGYESSPRLTMSSRWAANNNDEERAATERKRQKDEKKKAREEKQKRMAEQRERQQEVDNEPPTKRRKTASPIEEGASLLTFPSFNFGPSKGIDLYEVLNNIEEGSYGFVSRAKEKATGNTVALKRLKVEPHTSEGFPVTGLREIQTLRACSHPHIVHLREVIVGPSSLQE